MKYLLISMLLLACKTENPNSIFKKNFNKYVEMFYPKQRFKQDCHQYILLPNQGCGFCISVTEKFINTDTISNLSVLTNHSKNYNHPNVFFEDKTKESILSRINLKTGKGPAIIQFVNNEVVRIEVINADNYQNIFELIKTFEEGCK